LNTETGDISSDQEFNQPAKQERSRASAHPGIPLSVRCLCRDLASAEPGRRARHPRRAADDSRVTAAVDGGTTSVGATSTRTAVFL
jgi:hypothetical protein